MLKIGSPRAHFGWLVLAMAPGCFSGVAALFVMIPVGATLWQGPAGGQGVMWPIFVADGFGFLSATSVVLMYRHRHRILALSARRQTAFAGSVWGTHILMFVMVLVALWFSN